MRLGGRISAAIEVLQDIEGHHRPAGVALSDWGRSHRFAGSGDRAAIGNLVYDALRHKASIAWRMGDDNPRSLIFGVLAFHWQESADNLKMQLEGDIFAPEPFSEQEIRALTESSLDNAPSWVQADIPEWLESSFEANFSESFVEEGRALAERPPVDLRVNRIKTDREKVMRALKRFGPNPMSLAQEGVRLNPTTGPERSQNVVAEASYQKGWFEVQDEGSQVAAQLVFAQPGEQILDFCAGSGGKTMAIAAAMENKGQVYAYDADRLRLAPIFERLKRAGTRNVQVLDPDGSGLDPLRSKMDRVVVDAPCSGSGVWRRRPDSKWRIGPDALEKRLMEQSEILAKAGEFVRQGGYLCYITCSVLPEENEQQLYSFLEESGGKFELLSAGEVWEDLYGESGLKPWSADDCSITLTPAATGTDGFFFSVMVRTDED